MRLKVPFALLISSAAFRPALSQPAPRAPHGIYAVVDTAGLANGQLTTSCSTTTAQFEGYFVSLYQQLLSDPAIAGLTLQVHWDSLNQNAPCRARVVQRKASARANNGQLFASAILAIGGTAAAQTFHPDIPRAWDDKEVARLEVPLAQCDRSPRYPSAEQYYARKVRTVYRTYPVYAPGRAPAGYLESLKEKEPEIIAFDASQLRTKEDWVRAGEAVFNDSPFPFPVGPKGFQGTPGITFPVTREGIIPVDRYVIRQRGMVEQSNGTSCAACHTRVLPDGTALAGAQMDFAVYPAFAARFRSSPDAITRAREFDWITSGAPWVMPRTEFDKLTNEDLARRYEAMPAGVLERQGTSSTYPVRVPSLIGVADIKYLDATGLVRPVPSAT